MGFLNFFRTLDVYRDIPKEYTEQTLSGAIVSVVALVTMATLFFTETTAFLEVNTISQMSVDSTPDTNNQHSMLQINMNITVPRIPCAVVSVDAQDIMGSHVIDVGGKLHKTRLDKDGNTRGDFHESTPLQEQKGEGCNIHGNMIVKRVPGNFHVSAHAHSNLLYDFFGNDAMNVSHVIHDLSFGETNILNQVKGAYNNPLAGASKSAAANSRELVDAKSYEYYIKIVPSSYQTLDGNVHDSYQFVANSNEVKGRYRLPAIYFRYDMSPITMGFKQEKQTLAHYLVQICAIIGGVFTVLGIFNSMVNSTVRRMVAKANINKLG